MHFGATPDEWAQLSVILGLTADLLPVVSNPSATISPDSKMRDLGKTPSRYNRQRQVAGLKDWTANTASIDDIERWSKEPDYGICLQTRMVRALDLDISDPRLADLVRVFIGGAVGRLPVRHRNNSPKCLLAFTLPGDYTKRTIRTTNGIIEFLATGQQFIACGTHPSGARYEWNGGLPNQFPTLTPDQFETLWRDLQAEFGVAPPTEAKSSTRREVLLEAHKNDPVAVYLLDHGHVYSSERDGALNIQCPFSGEHTTDSAESATRYWPRFTGGYERGHFHCLHAHCEGRSDHDFLHKLGLADTDHVEFEPIVDTSKQDQSSDLDLQPVVSTTESIVEKPPRFLFQRVDEFEAGDPPEWIVKGVLPRATVGVAYGESGSGKSFLALDIAAAVADGVDWCGRKVQQGFVAYIAAEGGIGMRNRTAAYRQQYNGVLHDMVILADAPDFTKADDVRDVLNALRPFGRRPSLIVVDTLAQVTPGANENSGEDMGKVLGHCRALNKATGALVLLVHHSGKDATKGARGWSGLRAACDVEIEVERLGDRRSARVTKMKDGEDGAVFSFELRTVTLGVDDDLEAITSCVVEHTGTERVMRAEVTLGKNEKLIFDKARELINPGTGTVPRDAVVEATIEVMEPPIAGKKDNRKAMAKRALNGVIEKGKLILADGILSLAVAA